MAGIREKLELDLRSALTSIGGLERSLIDATRSFALGIGDALAPLRGVQVTADVQPLAASIQEVAAEPLIVETEADTAPAIDEIASIDPDEIQLDLFAQTDEAEAEIAAVDVEPLQLDLFADVESVEADIAAIDSEPIVVPIDGDPGPLEEQLSGLGSTAESASGGIDALSASSASFGAATGLAAGSADGLVSAVGSLGPKAAAATTALAGVASVAGVLFAAAIDAEAANLRFTQSFGGLAASVENIDIGNLNTTIEELAVSLGSSDENVRNAASSLNNFAESAGFGEAEAARYAEGIVVLSARATALNPALGDLGTNATSLQGALARGGRPLAKYGIALTGLQIAERAAQDTGKLATELTIVEKAAAGSALALEQFGGNLEADIALGAANPILQLKGLKEAFGNALEQIGQPIIAPVFELLESVLPVALAFASVIGDIAQVVLPLIIPPLQAIGGLLGVFSEQLSPIVDELGPAFADIGQALGAVFASLEPTLILLAEAFVEIVLALVPVITFAADVIRVIALLNEELKLLEIPAVLVAEYFGLIADAISSVTAIGADAVSTNEQIADSAEPLSAAVLSAAGSIEAFGTAADTTNATLDAFTQAVGNSLNETSNFALNNQIDDLLELGFTAETTAASLIGGSDATDTFIATLIESGEITGKAADGVTDLADALKANRAETILGVRANLGALEGNDELLQSYLLEKAAVDLAAEALLRKKVATGELSQAIFDQLVLENTATDGSINYSNAVNAASEAQAQYAAGLAAANVLLLEQLQADPTSLIEFTTAIANGTVAAQDFVVFGEQFGLTAEQVQAYAAGINQAINDFADTAASKFPTVQQVIADVDTAISPAAFLESIRLREAGVVAFQENIKKIAAAGGVDLAKELALAGPEVAGAQAGVFAEANAATILEVERGVDDLNTSNNNARNSYVTTFGPTFAQDLGEVSRIASEAFGTEFDIAGAITTETVVADKAAVDLGTAIQNTLDTEGEDAGSAFGLGLASGMEASTTAAEKAARELARNVASTMRYELQIRSPSRVGLSIGESLGEGFSLGLAESTRQVIATAEAITAAAAGALVTSDFGANSTVNAPAALASAGSSTATTTITQNIEVNEVASDPIATAERTAFLLGLAARR